MKWESLRILWVNFISIDNQLTEQQTVMASALMKLGWFLCFLMLLLNGFLGTGLFHY